MATELSGDIPVFVEDARVIEALSLVRCGYFTIERDEPMPGWTLMLPGGRVPFHLVHIAGIITEPIGAPRFHNKELIDRLFEALEKEQFASIDTSDIWLPPFLFGREPQSGDVYRVASALFKEASRYRHGSLRKDVFEKHCFEHKDAVQFSREETTAFSEWHTQEMLEAQKRFPKNRELMLRQRGRDI